MPTGTFLKYSLSQLLPCLTYSPVWVLLKREKSTQLLLYLLRCPSSPLDLQCARQWYFGLLLIIFSASASQFAPFSTLIHSCNLGTLTNLHGTSIGTLTHPFFSSGLRGLLLCCGWHGFRHKHNCEWLKAWAKQKSRVGQNRICRYIYTPYVWWFLSQKYRMYTVYIYISLWPTLQMSHNKNTYCSNTAMLNAAMVVFL
jgi:hypothetical protein